MASGSTGTGKGGKITNKDRARAKRAGIARAKEAKKLAAKRAYDRKMKAEAESVF